MAKLRFRCLHFRPAQYTGATVFLVAAFKSRHWYYTPIIKRLLASGFNVYVYDYPARPLLNAYPKQWVEFTQALTDDIKKNVAAEVARNPGVRFGIVGASVGSTLALHAAKSCPELERMVFITLYGSSAQLVWENKTLKKIKKKLVRGGKTMHEAFQIFGPMEATVDLKKLGQRPIKLFLSMDDQVISYSNANLFVHAAIKAGLNFSYTVVDAARHSVAIFKVFTDYPAWVPFLAELRDPALVARLGSHGQLRKARNPRAAMRRTSYV